MELVAEWRELVAEWLRRVRRSERGYASAHPKEEKERDRATAPFRSIAL